MRTPLLLLLFVFPAYLFAQNCDVKDSSDWQKVDVRLMIKKNPPHKFKVKGEAFIPVRSEVKTLEALNENELRQMKIKAAKAGCCLVFADMDDLWGEKEFPVRKANKLYF